MQMVKTNVIESEHYILQSLGKDAGEPLEVKCSSDSQINIPLKPWNG